MCKNSRDYLSKPPWILDTERIWCCLRKPACTFTGMSVSLTFSVGCASGSVECHIRRLYGNIKTGPKQIARPGCLLASPSLGLLTFSDKGYTESQTLCSVYDTHCASNPRHLCSSIKSSNRVGALAENMSRSM